MKKSFQRVSLCVLTLASAGILAGISCRRSEVHVARISIPGMDDEKAVRIATNAVDDEISGRYDATQHDYEIDMEKRLVLYHESGKLTSREYQRRIEAAIREVGIDARVTAVRHNPPPPVPTDEGPRQLWANRVTAIISVPAMDSRTAANRVVDAIAHARAGRENENIAIDRASRTVTVTYESLALSLSNIEKAVACAGYRANDVPAALGLDDSPPHGWDPVILQDPLPGRAMPATM